MVKTRHRQCLGDNCNVNAKRELQCIVKFKIKNNCVRVSVRARAADGAMLKHPPKQQEQTWKYPVSVFLA